MTPTILGRIYALAQASTNPLHEALSKVLRQLGDEKKAAPAKAHGATGAILDLSEKDQDRVLAAIEGLGA
jgi:hypothetical protein